MMTTTNRHDCYHHRHQASSSSSSQSQASSSSQSTFPRHHQHRRWILVLLTVALLSILSYTSHILQSSSPGGGGGGGQDNKTFSVLVWNRVSSSTWQKNALMRNSSKRSQSWDDDDDDDDARDDDDEDKGSPLEQPMTSSSSSSIIIKEHTSSQQQEQTAAHESEKHDLISKQDDSGIEQQKEEQPATWNLIRHYFNDTTTSSSSGGGGGSAGMDKPKPDVVWLLSFPNSGTSYTISNTEQVTNFSTASNYAGDWKDYVPPPGHAHLGYNGPFVHKPSLGLSPTSLLTKTHCGGYCDDCRPDGYVMESARAFQDACCLGERMLLNGNRSSVSYSANVVQKAVHLIRNPFDNLIARLHLAVKRRKRLGWDEKALEQFSHSSRASYLAWCNYVDTRHAKALEKTKLLSSNIKALMKGLPCHADWFRYVQWHNRAIQMTTEHLQIPVHYLFYENYSTNYNETLHELLEFLNLRPAAVNEPLPFQPGKTYMSMYSSEEIQAATRFVRAMATPACWNLLMHYFEEDEELQ